MLTVSARREVLLDVLGGQLDATRAVMTGRIQVSDLTKLLLFKSAFRFKRAVFEAFKNAQAAQQGPNTKHLDLKSRLEASPPSAELIEQLERLQGDTDMRDALLFAVSVHSGSDWTGDVLFTISAESSAPPTPKSQTSGSAAATATAQPPATEEPAATRTPPTVARQSSADSVRLLFSLAPGSVKLRVVPPSERPGRSKPACSVLCERKVLIDVLTGQFEITAATMSGQMQSDNFTAMMAFKRAFKFDRAAWQEFCAWKESRQKAGVSLLAPPPPPPTAVATGGAAEEEEDDEKAKRTAPGLERLADDHELYIAVSYLPYAFEQSDMTIGLLCHLSNEGEGTNRELGVLVHSEGVEIYADETSTQMETTCNVTCEREMLMQIIRGELDATNAIMSGLVIVDDLGQLLAFKMAFKLNREAFDEYLAKRGMAHLVKQQPPPEAPPPAPPPTAEPEAVS